MKDKFIEYEESLSVEKMGEVWFIVNSRGRILGDQNGYETQQEAEDALRQISYESFREHLLDQADTERKRRKELGIE